MLRLYLDPQTHNVLNEKKKQACKQKSLSGQVIEHGTFGTAFRVVTFSPPIQLNVFIEVKQLNCFNVMHEHINIINKHSQNFMVTFLTKCCFCNILACIQCTQVSHCIY